ncbi:LpxI family protein [Roseococcus sp. YIM B11640]|uniref:LpxI family protein n=1 Tax=Roseococcus sp. YIM B11640 TaxID=3133973 RepID=UPI003C7D2FD1
MKLGLVAGGGPFPGRVAEAAARAGHKIFVVCLKGFCDPAGFAAYPHAVERIGAGGAIIHLLRSESVTHVALAGKVKRPSMLSLVPDAWMAKAMARVGVAIFSGDDALFRAVVQVLGDEGFEVVSPQSLLQESFSEPGLLSGPEPDTTARSDIARGIQVLQSLAAMDIGQAVVVQQGMVLGIEAVEGTDALLARAGELRRDGPGGVLVKLAKTGQEMRVDAPVVGPITVTEAAQAGLRGIAVEAGRTILTERQAMLDAAHQAGLFLIAVDPAKFGP